MRDYDADGEPGVPGTDIDHDGRPYFFPSNRPRAADLFPLQRDGLVTRWQYSGHINSDTAVDRSMSASAGEDSQGRIRVVTTDGRSIHSWLELSGKEVDTVKATMDGQSVTGMTIVTPLGVLAVAMQGTNLAVFDSTTLKHLATLSTTNAACLHVAYNHARDEIISGGSNGCLVWRLSSTLSARTSASSAGPFQLTLLRGFTGWSEWTSKMNFDEHSQVLLAMNGSRLKAFDARNGKLRYCIDSEHAGALITSGLWFDESEFILTGGGNGIVKIWACQHTAAKSHQVRRNCAISRTRNRNRSIASRSSRRSAFKTRNNKQRPRKCGIRNALQTPALFAQFHGHSGAITGLVRHGRVGSFIVSAGVDKTLRLWDVNRLCAVVTVPVASPVASLMAYDSLGAHRVKLVCAGNEGTFSVMVLETICEFLGDAVHGAGRLRYYPPLEEDTAQRGRISETPATGEFLVELKQGLWGLLQESQLVPPAGMWSATNFDESSRQATAHNQANGTTPARRTFSGECEGSNGHAPDHRELSRAALSRKIGDHVLDTTAPLPSVTEGYTCHSLSVSRRRVVCLAAATGKLNVYGIKEVTPENEGKSDKGEERGKVHPTDYLKQQRGENDPRRLSSWTITPHVKGEAATCMCLLPETPSCAAGALDRVVASARAQSAGLRFFRGHEQGTTRPCSSDHTTGGHRWDECGAIEGGWGRTGEGGNTKSHGREAIAAIGTSHGGVQLVEIVVDGSTLVYLEGLFAGPITDIWYCHSAINATTTTRDAVAEGKTKTNPGNRSGRLVCMGRDTAGTMTIKGLALSPSFSQVFVMRLMEDPTCVCVASRRLMLATGYADGTVTATRFEGDRVHEIQSAEFTGKHTTSIETIAISERYRCIATGSVDGYLNIWDLNGLHLHTIHLQEPAHAVAFADVTGQLVVSRGSGIYRIRRGRWCPLGQLIAVERADRRHHTRSQGFSGFSQTSVHVAEEEARAPPRPRQADDISRVTYSSGEASDGRKEQASREGDPQVVGGGRPQVGGIWSKLEAGDVSGTKCKKYMAVDTKDEITVAQKSEAIVDYDSCYHAPPRGRRRDLPQSSELVSKKEELPDCGGDGESRQEVVRCSSGARQDVPSTCKGNIDVENGTCIISTSVMGAVIWRPKTCVGRGGLVDGGERTPMSPRAVSILDRMVSKVLSMPAPLSTHATKPGTGKRVQGTFNDMDGPKRASPQTPLVASQPPADPDASGTPATRPILTTESLHSGDITEDEVGISTEHKMDVVTTVIPSKQLESSKRNCAESDGIHPRPKQHAHQPTSLLRCPRKYFTTRCTSEHSYLRVPGGAKTTINNTASDGRVVDIFVEGKRPIKTVGTEEDGEECRLSTTIAAAAAAAATTSRPARAKLVRSVFIPCGAKTAPEYCCTDSGESPAAVAQGELQQQLHGGDFSGDAMDTISFDKRSLHPSVGDCSSQHAGLPHAPSLEPPHPPNWHVGDTIGSVADHDFAFLGSSQKWWDDTASPSFPTRGDPAVMLASGNVGETAAEPVTIRRLLGQHPKERMASLSSGTGGAHCARRGQRATAVADTISTRGGGRGTLQSCMKKQLGERTEAERRSMLPAPVDYAKDSTLAKDRATDSSAAVVRPTKVSMSCGAVGGTRGSDVLSPSGWNAYESDALSRAVPPNLGPATTSSKPRGSKGHNEQWNTLTSTGRGTFFPVRPQYQRRTSSDRGQMFEGGNKRVFGRTGRIHTPMSVPMRVAAVRGDSPLVTPENTSC